MPHIPQSKTTQINVLSFEDARNKTPKKLDYNEKEWIYIPKSYEEYRYVIGTVGKKPLVCIGINPSTAKPNKLDKTLQSVERITRANKFDSFIMLNIYAQRSTKPDMVEESLNKFLHDENMKAFEYILGITKYCRPHIWAAWGENIQNYSYYLQCLEDIVEIANKYNADWYWVKDYGKLGHPRHPLYLERNTQIRKFDINAYLTMLK